MSNFGLASLLVARSFAPRPQSDGGSDGDSDGGEDGGFNVGQPILTPCPPGWVEVANQEQRAGVVTCDPWPDGDPVTLPELEGCCPAGWREVADGDSGLVTCDPWPDGGPASCADDEAHFPGDSGCSRIGAVCPAGDWAEDLPTDGEVLFVRAGEPTGGDGSRDLPFGRIRDAVAEARGGTVIALSRGTFNEAVRLQKALTLWGACVAETVVTTTLESQRGTVSAEAQGTVVRNLRIGGHRPGATVTGGSRTSLHLEDVVIQSARGIGLLVGSGSLSAQGLIVRDTESLSDGTFGLGLQVQDGVEADVRRAVFERNRAAGVVALERGAATLTDIVVRSTQPEANGVGGIGLVAEAGGQVDLIRAVVQGSAEAGALATGADTRLSMTDVVVLESASEPGLSAADGARVNVSHAVFEGNNRAGVVTTSASTTVSLTDVVLRDTRLTSDGGGGFGLEVQSGSVVEVSRAVLERNRSQAVRVRGEGTRLTMADVVVRDTRPDGEGWFGRGLVVTEGAETEVSRAVFDRSWAAAVSAGSEGTRLSMTDVVIRDTLSRRDGSFGRGIEVDDGAQVEVRRGAISHNGEVSVVASGSGTKLVMTDVVVRDTRSDGDGSRGNGLHVQKGAAAEVTRALFERNREVCVSATIGGTMVAMTDVVVAETLERECVDDGCEGGGIGVGSYGGSHVELTRFVVTGSALCGIQLAHGGYHNENGDAVLLEQGGTMDLHHGRVVGNPIGASLQTQGFDVDRLQDHVLWDNESTEFSSSELYVPSVGDVLGGTE